MLLSQFGNNNNNFIIIMRNRSHLRSRIFWSCWFLIQMLLFIKEYSTEEECHRKYDKDCNFKLIRKQECTNHSSKHVSCAVAVFLKISTSDFVWKYEIIYLDNIIQLLENGSNYQTTDTAEDKTEDEEELNNLGRL